MPDKDIISERGRGLEEEYFRKRDRELIEKMRQEAAVEQARGDMARKTGLTDPALLQELQSLGFTPETVGLLPLVPILQVAWAEGGITSAERDLLVKVARSRGIEPASDADRQLSEWLDRRPDAGVFASAGRLIRAMLDAGSPELGSLSVDDLVRYCEKIAAASGGVLGIGRISPEEKALLSSIASELEARRS